VTACAALLSATAAAQETVNFGSVSGRDHDEQGAVVPEARVVARQLDTNQSSEQLSDGSGRFRFPYLRVGRYEIVVSRDGFAEHDAHARGDGRLGVRAADHAARGGLDTTVSVSAEAPSSRRRAVRSPDRARRRRSTPAAERPQLPRPGAC
jgi:hypothetical protein